MKRILTTIMAAVIIVTLCACGAGAPDQQQPTEKTDNGYTLETTVGAPQQWMSEKTKNAELEQLIIDTWQIPEDALQDTRYYYNCADLNGDGTQEILAMAVGEYTSGSGGSSVIIASQKGGKLSSIQDFAAVDAPIVIAETLTGGWNDLMFATGVGWVRLTWDGESYIGYNSIEKLFSDEELSGVAIICDDMAADIDNPSALRLG